MGYNGGMDAERKTELAEQLGRAMAATDGLAAVLQKSHDALWTGHTREAFEEFARARRIVAKLAEAMDHE